MIKLRVITQYNAAYAIISKLAYKLVHDDILSF